MSKSVNKKKRTPLPKGLRITLKVLRALLVPVLCLSGLYVGLVIGYVYVGGQDSADILHLSTWKHLVDLIFADG